MAIALESLKSGFNSLKKISFFGMLGSQPKEQAPAESGSNIFNNNERFADSVKLSNHHVELSHGVFVNMKSTTGNIDFLGLTAQGPLTRGSFSSNVTDDTQKLLAHLTQTVFNYSA